MQWLSDQDIMVLNVVQLEIAVGEVNGFVVIVKRFSGHNLA